MDVLVAVVAGQGVGIQRAGDRDPAARLVLEIVLLREVGSRHVGCRHALQHRCNLAVEHQLRVGARLHQAHAAGGKRVELRAVQAAAVDQVRQVQQVATRTSLEVGDQQRRRRHGLVDTVRQHDRMVAASLRVVLRSGQHEGVGTRAARQRCLQHTRSDQRVVALAAVQARGRHAVVVIAGRGSPVARLQPVVARAAQQRRGRLAISIPPRIVDAVAGHGQAVVAIATVEPVALGRLAVAIGVLAVVAVIADVQIVAARAAFERRAAHHVDRQAVVVIATRQAGLRLPRGIQAVAARSTHQRRTRRLAVVVRVIIATAAGGTQAVVARAAIEVVAAGTAVQAVVACQASQCVVFRRAGQAVVERCADDVVGHVFLWIQFLVMGRGRNERTGPQVTISTNRDENCSVDLEDKTDVPEIFLGHPTSDDL